MRVWVYIDGFNLYNGIVKKTSGKWLDLLGFARTLLPKDEIERIKYFTAQVQARENDPNQVYRQLAYWRALKTIPCLEIIKGHFMTQKKWMPLASSVDAIRGRMESGLDVSGRRPKMVEVYRSEEKGTDVNLATHLVHDAHLNRFEGAVIISNDSDLCESVRIVKEELKKTVGVLTPHPESPSVELKKAASFFRSIHAAKVIACQFPDTLTDAKGTFSKPREW